MSSSTVFTVSIQCSKINMYVSAGCDEAPPHRETVCEMQVMYHVRRTMRPSIQQMACGTSANGHLRYGETSYASLRALWAVPMDRVALSERRPAADTDILQAVTLFSYSAEERLNVSEWGPLHFDGGID